MILSNKFPELLSNTKNIQVKKMLMVGFLAVVLDTHGQGGADAFTSTSAFDRVTAVLSVILVVYIISAFILAITRLILQSWIKNKMVGKAMQEDVIASILQHDKKEVVFDALKWAIIFTGSGVGLLICSLFPPPGMHTLSIMCFALAVSFFVYYRLVKGKVKA
jgi:hypothetical protein